MKEERRRALLGAFVIVASTAAVFAPLAVRCGFYSDDYGFLARLSGMSSHDLLSAAMHWSAGREVVLPFSWLLIHVSHGDPRIIHLLGLALHVSNALLLYLLVIQWSGLVSIALPAALLFAHAANHAETHFWFTQFQQCGLAVFLLLSAHLAAGKLRGRPTLGLIGSLLVFSLALFSYDQCSPLWIPLLAYGLLQSRNDAMPLMIAIGAAAGSMLSVSHGLYRYFSHAAIGGKPILTAGHLGGQALLSLKGTAKSFLVFHADGLPGERLWMALAAGLGAVIGGFALASWGLIAREEKASLEAFLASGRPLALTAFGGAWLLLSYMFLWPWYLSPRHNYLPSVGIAMALVGTGVWAAGRSNRLHATFWPVILLLAACMTAANVHEGREFIASAALQEAYHDEARRWPPGITNAFVLGAPRAIGWAPALRIPPDATTALALDGRSPGLDGDVGLTPAGRRAIHHNDIDLYGRDSFQWAFLRDVNAIAYAPDRSFHCLRALRLHSPDGGILEAALRRSPGCDGWLDETLKAAAVTSDVSRSKSSGGTAVPGLPSLRLKDHSLSATPTLLSLEMTWGVGDGPKPDLALVPIVLSADGGTLFEPVYPDPGGGTYLWPLVDDLRPVSTWRAGSSVHERFLLRTPYPIPSGPCLLRLELYGLESGSASKIGVIETPSSLPPGNPDG